MQEKNVEFQWFAGMAISQKQRSIESLHAAAKRKLGVHNVLEISSKSPDAVGVRLSAFNLMLPMERGPMVAVEVAYQASKRFQFGGPFVDILAKSAREARGDERLKTSGHLVGFLFEEAEWSLKPETAFYDWLYLRALRSNEDLSEGLSVFDAFTDIEFNPEKSINCQARAAALYVCLQREGVLEEAFSSTTAYIRLLGRTTLSTDGRLF